MIFVQDTLGPLGGSVQLCRLDAHYLGNNGHAARLMRPDDRRGGAHWSNEEVAKL